MFYSLQKSDVAARDRRPRSRAKASVACETLEGRQLLSGGLGLRSGSWLLADGGRRGCLVADRSDWVEACVIRASS